MNCYRLYILIGLLFLGLMCPQKIIGQDVVNDFKKMVAIYETLNHFQVSIAVEIYSDSSDSTHQSQMNASLTRDGNNYLTHIGPITNLVNSQCNLVIDRASKIIQYSDSTDSAEISDEVSIGKRIEQIQNLSEFLIEKQVSDDTKYYLFETIGSKVERTELVLDRSSLLIQQITYYYKKSSDSYRPKVVIRYNWERDVTFDKTLFSEERFILKLGNEVNPQPEYQNYKVVRSDM